MAVVLDEPVLVLNGNFEPLNVCSTQRALALVLTDKATIVQNGRGVVHTISAVYPVPSIIRIHAIIHRPLPRLRPTRREIFRRDGYRCQYCGREVPNLTVDHVVPQRRGGHDTWQNLVAACPACNVHKGERTPEEAGMPLLSRPYEPHPTAMYRFGRYLTHYEAWRPFLEGW